MSATTKYFLLHMAITLALASLPIIAFLVL